MSIAHGLLKLYFQIAQFSERFITDNKKEVFNWYAKKMPCYIWTPYLEIDSLNDHYVDHCFCT